MDAAGHYERKMKRVKEKMAMVRAALQRHAIAQKKTVTAHKETPILSRLSVLRYAEDLDAVNIALDEIVERLR